MTDEFYSRSTELMGKCGTIVVLLVGRICPTFPQAPDEFAPCLPGLPQAPQRLYRGGRGVFHLSEVIPRLLHCFECDLHALICLI